MIETQQTNIPSNEPCVMEKGEAFFGDTEFRRNLLLDGFNAVRIGHRKPEVFAKHRFDDNLKRMWPVSIPGSTRHRKKLLRCQPNSRRIQANNPNLVHDVIKFIVKAHPPVYHMTL